MKIKSYISEMRARISYILFAFICTFFLAYQKILQLTYIFLLSFSERQNIEKKFIFTDVYEAFSSSMTICIISSILLLLPFITYQIICFLLPTWYISERQLRCANILIFFFCWIVYLYMVHFIIIPDLCSFFLKFEISTICLTITVQAKILSYLSWAIGLFFLAALVFMLGWVVIVCVVYRLISIQEWGKYHKIYIWFSLLCASILSPPEPWSQILLALLFFFFCEAVIWICFVYYRKSNFIKPDHTSNLL